MSDWWDMIRGRGKYAKPQEDAGDKAPAHNVDKPSASDKPGMDTSALDRLYAETYGGERTDEARFKADAVMTACSALSDVGYNEKPGVDRKAFAEARRLEIKLIDTMYEIEQDSIRRGAGVEPVTYKIGDYAHLRPKPKSRGWFEKDAEGEPDIRRIRDHTGRPTVDDLARDELSAAYEKAGIPQLVKEFRRDRELTEPDELVRETMRAARRHIHIAVGKNDGTGRNTAG